MLFQAAQAANQAAQQAAQLELAGGQPTNTNALAIRRPFDPRAHDLDAHFRLTRFADLKGWGCKVPQDVLLKLLEGLQDDANSQEEHHFMHMAIPRIGEFVYIFYVIFEEQLIPLIRDIETLISIRYLKRAIPTQIFFTLFFQKIKKIVLRQMFKFE